MEIPRDRYLKELLLKQGNGMIKVVTGIRRCGKSYLLSTIFKRHLLRQGVEPGRIIEIALDGIESEGLRDPHACHRHILSRIKGRGDHFLLLDEVQFLPRFEEVLNSLLRIRNLDVYVTGSNSRFLSSDIATEFRGRGDELRIHPASFAEFFAVAGKEYDAAWEEYTTYGGLPQTILLKTERQKAEYLKNIFANVYLKDVVERNRARDEDALGMLVDALASAIGSLTNPAKIANTFASRGGRACSPRTVANRIGWLADAFLVSRADRYDVKGRKHIGANRKYYFTDVGLRNARLNFRQQEPTRLMENVIYNELRIRGYNVDVGVVPVVTAGEGGGRARGSLEVDFVVNRGSQRYYIQSAYAMETEEKLARELRPLRVIPDSFKKIVLTGGTRGPWRNEEGFVFMGMKPFLLDADSLEF